MNEREDLRQSILAQVAEYYKEAHAQQPFIPGESMVHYAGRVFDAQEMQNMVSAVLDFWLTAGPYAERFEETLSNFLNVREVVPVNSGSSANLIAVARPSSPPPTIKTLCFAMVVSISQLQAEQYMPPT